MKHGEEMFGIVFKIATAKFKMQLQQRQLIKIPLQDVCTSSCSKHYQTGIVSPTNTQGVCTQIWKDA